MRAMIPNIFPSSKFVACFLLLALTLSPLVLQAAPVAEHQAALVARNWMLDRTGIEHDVSLIPSQRSSAAQATKPKNHYRVFNMVPDGWVIVSSDDVAYPIIAYSTQGRANEDDIPLAYKDWMIRVNRTIHFALQPAGRPPHETNASSGRRSADPDASARPEATSVVIADAWETLKKAAFEPERNPYDTPPALTVAPLIRTTWAQGTFYNQLTPNDKNGPDGHALVGCCAVAVAQVLNYHRSYSTGFGSNTYLSAKYGTLSANFAATTYRWNSIPLTGSLTGYNPSLATLLYHAGISVDMHYGASSSGCDKDAIPEALMGYFGYQTWMVPTNELLIKGDLSNRRPIIYLGEGAAGGHAFILDGAEVVEDKQFYHFNWGWNGSHDGYFLLTGLTPGGSSFNDNQYIVFFIQPRNTAAPAPPSFLTATAVSASQIDLTWRDNSASELIHFIGQKKGGAGTWELVAQLNPNVTTYSVHGLTAGVSYFYQVFSWNAFGRSPNSNIAFATTPTGNVPLAPSSLAATAISASQIDLSWQDNSTNERGFRVQRRSSGSNWSDVATVHANIDRYSNSGLTARTTYFYRVVAVGLDGVVSDYSNETSATTLGGTVVKPKAPTKLVPRAVSSTQVNLTWRDNSANEMGFRIERKVGTGAWVAVGEATANASSFANPGLTANTSYRYRVLAYNASGASGYATSPVVKTPRY
jgi:hypothetical protein